MNIKLQKYEKPLGAFFFFRLFNKCVFFHYLNDGLEKKAYFCKKFVR